MLGFRAATRLSDGMDRGSLSHVPAADMLTESQLRHFTTFGFVHLRGAFSAEQMAAVTAHADALLAAGEELDRQQAQSAHDPGRVPRSTKSEPKRKPPSQFRSPEGAGAARPQGPPMRGDARPERTIQRRPPEGAPLFMEPVGVAIKTIVI